MSLLEHLREALAPQYEVEREVASGGMGTVYLARDTVLDRRVAIKVHHPDLASESAAQRLLQEPRILAQLKHPNIVGVHEVGRERETVYIVSDYVEGLTLADWLSEQRMTFREAAELCAKIAEALSCRVQTVENLRKRLVTEGFRIALDGKPRETPPRQKCLDGKRSED